MIAHSTYPSQNWKKKTLATSRVHQTDPLSKFIAQRNTKLLQVRGQRVLDRECKPKVQLPSVSNYGLFLFNFVK